MASLQYLHCISNGDTVVLHQTIDITKAYQKSVLMKNMLCTEMLSTLLALWDENQPVIGGLPSQRACNAEFLRQLCCYPEKTLQTVEEAMICDTITLIWRHCYWLTLGSNSFSVSGMM